jgi:transcriptional regulator with XRE-family HTH domain
MTNRQFAAEIGVTESYASLIRAGKRLPGAAALVAIATVFELDANDLVRAYREGPKALAAFLAEVVPRVE